MNIAGIDIFLSIVEHGTISRAADVLFLSQSTVSTRLKVLEEELGTPLIKRKKGQRYIELTPYGKAFVPIAERWISLWKDTRSLKEEFIYNSITISGVDNVNNFTLLPLYKSIIKSGQNLKLEIQTFHTKEIHEMIEKQNIDLGFVFGKHNSKYIISQPIYQEQMYLICHKDSRYYDGIEVSQLERRDEVHLNWNAEYLHWHHSKWDPEEKPFITVNTGSSLIEYLDIPDKWSIAPISLIKCFNHKIDLVYYTIKPAPPKNTCYMLSNRYPRESHVEGICLFLKQLDEYLDNCAWIEKIPFQQDIVKLLTT